MSTKAPQIKACAVCHIQRPRVIDRAHIIPRHLVDGVSGFRRLARFEGKNIVYLCRNHHTLFDAYDLAPVEWEKLTPHIQRMEKEILALLNSDLRSFKKKLNHLEERQHNNKVRAHERWRQRFGTKLVELDILEHYGKKN